MCGYIQTTDTLDVTLPSKLLIQREKDIDININVNELEFWGREIPLIIQPQFNPTKKGAKP